MIMTSLKSSTAKTIRATNPTSANPIATTPTVATPTVATPANTPAKIAIFVGSTNPVKIKATHEAARQQWPDVEVVGMAIKSGISEQPLSDEETRQGALQRAQAALDSGLASYVSNNSTAKKDVVKMLGLGLEGGVFEYGDQLWNTVWAVVVDQEGKIAVANGARFSLPQVIANKIRQGEEMGPVMESLVGEMDIRSKQGMIGILTQGFITRTQEYASIAKMALGLWYGRKWEQEVSSI
jgi:inosine/xanthosine triphosphatase